MLLTAIETSNQSSNGAAVVSQDSDGKEEVDDTSYDGTLESDDSSSQASPSPAKVDMANPTKKHGADQSIDPEGEPPSKKTRRSNAIGNEDTVTATTASQRLETGGSSSASENKMTNRAKLDNCRAALHPSSDVNNCFHVSILQNLYSFVFYLIPFKNPLFALTHSIVFSLQVS